MLSLILPLFPLLSLCQLLALLCSNLQKDAKSHEVSIWLSVCYSKLDSGTCHKIPETFLINFVSTEVAYLLSSEAQFPPHTHTHTVQLHTHAPRASGSTVHLQGQKSIPALVNHTHPKIDTQWRQQSGWTEDIWEVSSQGSKTFVCFFILQWQVHN